MIPESVVGILVMLNNFLHDFAVALLFTSLLVLTLIYRMVREESPEGVHPIGRRLYNGINRVVLGCWVFIFVGGAIRTYAYERYEWLEAAGRGQVVALIVKHALLVSLVVVGTVLHLRLRRLFRRSAL